MLVFSISNINMVLEARAVLRATPVVMSRGVLNGNGHCIRGAQPHTFGIGVFKTVKKNSTKINIFTINLQTQLSAVMLILTPMIASISYERCQ